MGGIYLDIENLMNIYSQTFKLAYVGYSYRELRKIHPEYNSQIISNAIYDALFFRRAVVKTHRYPKKMSPFPLLRKLDYKFDGNNVEIIYKPRNRLKLKVFPTEKQLKIMKEGNVKGARVVKRDDKYFLNINVEKEVEMPRLEDCKTFVGVDIGLNYLAVCSTFDGKKFGNPLFFKGGEWKHLTRRQRKINPTQWKHLTNRKIEIIHTVAKRIVEYAKKFEKPVIVMEDLRIRNHRTWNKWNNFLLSSWARKKLQKLIELKANWEGIPVYYVNPYKTSKICCYCGAEGVREGTKFVCPNCGRELNADFNASVNLSMTAFRRLKKDDRKAFLHSFNAVEEGNAYLPDQAQIQPGNGSEMKRMIVTRTLTLPIGTGR